MASKEIEMPSLPEGFELTQEKNDTPKLPPGFELVSEKSEKKPSFFESAFLEPIRGPLRTGARAVESIAGIPGEVTHGIGSLFGITPRKGAPPRQEKIREFTRKLSGEFLEPKNEMERFSDEATEFIAPMLIPFFGQARTAKSVLSMVGKGLAATGIGKAVEDITGSEDAGTGTQIGSYLLMSMLNPKGMGNYISNLYKGARETIPKNAKISPRVYSANLTKLEKEITSSLSPSNAQKQILNKINEIKERAKGRISPERILDTKQSINADLSDLMKQADRPTRKMLRRYMKRLSGISDQALEDYGKKNPKFWELQSAADNAFATRAESEWVANSIKNALEGKKYPHLEKAFPFLLHGGIQYIPGVGTGTGTVATPAYFLGRFIYRYAKSPSLRRYYNQLLKGGLENNAVLIEKAAKNLNQELEKEPLNQ